MRVKSELAEKCLMMITAVEGRIIDPVVSERDSLVIPHFRMVFSYLVRNWIIYKVIGATEKCFLKLADQFQSVGSMTVSTAQPLPIKSVNL